MLLQLNHKSLYVYKAAIELLKESYLVSKKIPSEERFNLSSQIKRAALSVKLNIAESSSRKSPAERKRFYEIARGSVIEIDAIAESIVELEYLSLADLSNLSVCLNKCFSMLTNMLR